MKNFKFNGHSVSIVATAALTSGMPFAQGEIAGAVVTDAAIGESTEVQLTGVVEFPKDNTVAMTLGDKVYTDGALINKTDTDSEIGVCFADEALDSETVQVRLKGGAASFSTM